ncbi:MAG: hypothetical protein P8N52_08850 [Crocinitomicaceae bacterium]|nr:hypothetical protein [Crocinitomicaceae bacterium]MDG1777439.1 hypothetical protein [Crocinitomicaceae bacterium]
MKELNPDKFQSPAPLLIKFRNVIFGKESPDIYTKITFTCNLFIWATFMLWNSVSYFTITMRSIILEQKGIPVAQIIQKRGLELGFETNTFLPRLLTFHAVAIICWGVVFFGLILLYRKKKQFSYFVLGGVGFYLGMSVFYLNLNYFLSDTTTFDKIALLVLIASITLHAFLMKNERSGGSISFFGEDEEGHLSE